MVTAEAYGLVAHLPFHADGLLLPLEPARSSNPCENQEFRTTLSERVWLCELKKMQHFGG
jgi:hypothetical protein